MPRLISAARQGGHHPGHICQEGRIVHRSKSGTLTYEAIHQLSRHRRGRPPASASAATR
jgi:succinyl-CoA synthetase alpha subunit